jgi:TonB family protein
MAAAPEKAANELPTPLPITLDESALARIALAKAAQAAKPPSTVVETPASHESSPGVGASIDDSSATTAASSSLPQHAPEPVVRSVEPKLMKMVQPEYPQEALMRGIEGWVDISLQVTAAGDVIAPRVEETSRGRVFNRAALAAVQQWKYEPRGDGAPTEKVRVRLQFQQSN